MSVLVPSLLPVLMQGIASLEIFLQLFHHWSDKREEVVLFLSPNDTSCWSKTCSKPSIRLYITWFHTHSLLLWMSSHGCQ